MIVPMHKYSFLVYHQEVQTFLDQLMELGVVDVSSSSGSVGETSAALMQEIQTAEQLYKRLQRWKPKDATKATAPPSSPLNIQQILQLEKEWEEVQQKKLLRQKEIDVLEPWGNIREEDWAKIREMGIRLHFFICPKKQFKPAWQQAYPLEIIHRNGGMLYFVIFERGEEIELPIREIELPKISLEAARQELQALTEREASIRQQLEAVATYQLDQLQSQIDEKRDQLQLALATEHAQPLAADKAVLIEGWCPADRQAELEQFLDQHKIAYLKGEARQDEKPPVLLKNNGFTRLFEPIGNLFSLPASTELDLTPYFAPFFLLFFGFCLGDAGYGLVLLLFTTLAKFKVAPQWKPYLTLAQLFGISTVVMGVLSGTFFGLEMAKIEALANFRQLFLDQNQLLYLSLAIGFAQILFGIGIRAYKQVRFRGWAYAIAPAGWIVALLALVDMYVTKLLPGVSLYILLLGVAMIVLFNRPDKGILYSLAFGVLDLYNITSIMGDLLSYIRLFALGISSAILGLVINNIAVKALEIPYVGWLFFVLMLVVGHLGNLLLASLSAFVHPMRLTFVEFYKNAGFEGGGKPFKPFKKSQPKTAAEIEKS